MPSHIFFQQDSVLSDVLSLASHGDMIIKPGDRTTGVFFVKALDEHGNDCKKEMIQKDETGAGYCSIPLPITRHFKNPVDIYLPLLEIKKAGIKRTDWYLIELDPLTHADFIGSILVKGQVASNRRVVYLLHGDVPKGVYIWNPETKDDITGWKKLDKKIDSKYLQSEPYTLSPSDITQLQDKNRKLYQDKFLKWIQTLTEGQTIDIRNIPEDINKLNQTGATSSSVTYLHLSTQDGKEIVHTIMREYTDWDQKTGERNFNDVSLIFIPEILATEGPFGNVSFWVNRSIQFFLDPPVWDKNYKKIK